MTHIKAIFAALLPLGPIAILLASACTLDDAFINEADVFFCTQNSDCESGFKCQLSRCVTLDTAIPCTTEDQDKDGDGFGSGMIDRSTCPNGADFDFNDACPECYPGALELCDAKWNTKVADMPPTGAEEEFDCANPAECGKFFGGVIVNVVNESAINIRYNENVNGVTRPVNRTFQVRSTIPSGTSLGYTCIENKCRLINLQNSKCSKVGAACIDGQYDFTQINECVGAN